VPLISGRIRELNKDSVADREARPAAPFAPVGLRSKIESCSSWHHLVTRSCCKTRFELLSGHGFNRAEAVSPRPRLQPLRANDALQGLKPTLFPISIGTTEVVPW